MCFIQMKFKIIPAVTEKGEAARLIFDIPFKIIN